MICFTVTFQFAPEDVPKAMELLQQLTAETRKEPGCVLYLPHRSEQDPNRFFLYERYKDQISLEEHRNSPHFARFATNGLYKIVKGRDIEFLVNVG